MGGLKKNNYTMKNKRNVWTVTTKPLRDAQFATFPMDLIEPCVLAGCPEGGTILDPFGGAGTTGLVARKHNRNSILIELNPKYIEIAKSRITKMFGSLI
jgi:DNA modification methylase